MGTENQDATPAKSVAGLTHTCQEDSLTSKVVTALEDAWAAIREVHSEVPNAVIVVASGTSMRRPRWQHDDNRLPEILVSGDGLKRPAAEVFTTVLHEATHALADARGIQDTSRQGRWHNRRFAALANELGMDATKDPRIGWSLCQLRDTTAARYRGVLDDLTAALAMYRHPELARASRRNSNNPISCTCGSPRHIRVARITLELGPISCGVCGSDFEPSR